MQDVRFRGSYQRAVRAPNVVELFTAQGFNLFDLPGDPCGADLVGTAGEAARTPCLATGVPAAVFDDLPAAGAGQPGWPVQLPAGRQPRICVPEESDTYTYGVILQPRFLPKLAMSIDYFDIEIEDTISTVGADTTLDACYFQDDAESCARIERDANNGSLWRGDGNVVDLNTNIGSLSTKG